MDFQQEGFSRGVYEECVFSACSFQECDLSLSRFVDCTFSNCNLSNAHVAETVFQGVQFNDCKMMGIRMELASKHLFTAVFNHCVLSYSSFRGRKMNRWKFKDCIFHHTDFSGSDLGNAVFAHCDLKEAVFDKTNLQGADLTQAFNFTIDPEANAVKKARFQLSGLPGLLTKYGLKIEP